MPPLGANETKSAPQSTPQSLQSSPKPVPQQNPQPQKASGGFWKGVWEWVKVIALALLIALPIRFFIAEPFVVSGASMDPTFSTGQFLIVDRLTYDFRKPQRGDVIVFKYPYANPIVSGRDSVYYIKRIVGLPGETVYVKNGVISVGSTPTSTPVALKETYIEANHRSHDTYSGKTLGPTEYFVLGDNRAESSDSRMWGPLDSRFIIGRPVVRLTPLSAIGLFPGYYNETKI
jgi:signal peptidase I